MASRFTVWPYQEQTTMQRSVEGESFGPTLPMSTARYEQTASGLEQHRTWQDFNAGGPSHAPIWNMHDMQLASRASAQSPQVMHIRNQLSETQSQLSDALSERIRTPDSQVLTMQELSGKIERLKHEMSLQALALKHQAQELHDKDLMLLRQAEAMSANCNNLVGWQNHMHQAQLSGHGSQWQVRRVVPQWSSQSNQYISPDERRLLQPPSFQQWNPTEGLPAATPTRPTGSQQGLLNGSTTTPRTYMTPVNRQQARPGQDLVDERGSPMHRRAQSQLSNPFLTPRGTGDKSSNGMASNNKSGSSASSGHVHPLTAPPPSLCANRPPSTGTAGEASLALSTMSSTDNMREAFQDLVDNVVAYAYTYVNWPTTAGDKNLPQYIKDIVKDATHQKHAHRLIKTPDTRFYVISKIILTWMWKNILHPESFFGLDEELERIIRHHREQIKPENCAAPVRYIHLSHIAAQFQQLRVNAGYSRHIKMLMSKRSSDLFSIIQPMAHLHKPGEWEQFHSLIKQAHKVAETLFGGHTEYWWRFPDMRDPFCADTMSNLDKTTGLTPAELEGQHVRVRVAATPHIRARKTHKDGRTIQLDLIKASVLPNYVPPERCVEKSGNW